MTQGGYGDYTTLAGRINKSSKMRVVLYSVLTAAALLLLAIILYFTLRSGQVEPRLKVNATCKYENLTGICKNKDSCQTKLTNVKLKACNEGDLSLVCCPLEQVAIPREIIQPDLNLIHNRPRRTPGEKAKEMCNVYGQYAYRQIPNPSFIGPPFINETVCKPETLVKGGQNAEENEFPHMVQIGNFDQTLEEGMGGIGWVCGGALISPEYILSAAHCKVTKEFGYAMVGTHIVQSTNEFFEKNVLQIKRVYIHPQYNPATNDNDIALYKLASKMNTSEIPICLDTGMSLNNFSVIATGFGLDQDQKSSDILQKVNLNIVDEESCSAKYAEINKPLPRFPVCAYAEGKDTCEGDSGGPLQIHEGTLQCMYTLIGVTSFGINCTLNTNFPGVYTRVAPYIEWIEDIVWPA